MGKIQTVGKGGACRMGKLKYFFSRYVHTERIGAGPCMACDHAPKEKMSYGKKHGKYGKNWVLVGKIHEKYRKNWVCYGGKNQNMGKIG